MFDINSVVLKSEQEIMRAWSSPEKIVVSIVCTAYNHENYIEDAIKGFLMQETNFAFEVIIHDDASTDGTVQIIKSYEEKYPLLIKPIYQRINQFSQNKKPFNISTKKAIGKYVALCEGDDYWTDSNKIQLQCDFLNRNEEYSCCYHDAFSFFEEKIISHSTAIKKDFSKKDLLYNKFIFRTLSLVYRNVFSDFPEEKNYAENGDIFLMSLLGLHGKGKYIDEINPAAYRVHPQGIWSGKNKEQASIMTATSRFWLFVYHRREGRNFLAYHFLGRAMFLLIHRQSPVAQVSACLRLIISMVDNVRKKALRFIFS